MPVGSPISVRGQLSGGRGGGGRESNPPSAAKRCTGFEGRSGALAALRPVTRGFAFSHRPRTYKDL
jgi:hypothetical protein